MPLLRTGRHLKWASLLGIVFVCALNASGQTEATGAAIVEASGYHTCAVTVGGGMSCWGHNDSGELGTGTTENRSFPAAVVGLNGDIAAVSGGIYYTCTVTTAGAALCWGSNHDGVLGTGSSSGPETCPEACSKVPVSVSVLTSNVAAISAGSRHTCALTIAGAAKCWGHNGQGRLGNGTTTSSNTPVDVTGLTDSVAAISVGQGHTCAVTTDGAAKCWGDNSQGRLGIGTTGDRSTPTDVVGLSSGVAAISLGEVHSCALTVDGGVKCWGNNGRGELGDGTPVPYSYAPVDVSNLTSGVTAIAAGGKHTCALMSGGSVRCWGDNHYGQCGIICHTAFDVTGLTNDVVAVSAGSTHTCALTDGGAVKCWGRNEYGELGNGRITGNSQPEDVLGLGEAPDSDNDGCPDARETATGIEAETLGGNRDAKNPWDYFNPTGDGENRVDDVLAVLSQYGEDQYRPGLPVNSTNTNGAYVAVTDRTTSGPNAWNLGPPNGLQRIDDVVYQVKQYFHDC